MKKMGFMCLGIVLSLVIAEVMFRLLPTVSGMQNPSPTATDPLIHYFPRSPYCYSRGWSFRNSICGAMNNLGYPSALDYSTAATTVVVIGDSYVEGLMTPAGGRLHEQIHKRLGHGRQAIGLGISGFDLADYLVAADYATKTFQVSGLVFLVNDGDIHGAASPRLRGHWFKDGPGGIEVEYSAKVGLRNALYGSALLSYLYGNLKFDPKAMIRRGTLERTSHRDTVAPGDRSLPNRDYVVKFLEEMRSLCAVTGLDPRRVLFVMDADRGAIYKGRAGQTLSAQLKELVVSRGFRFVDLDRVFRADWEAHRRAFDFGSVDAHWNSYAHNLVATRVVALLEGHEP